MNTPFQNIRILDFTRFLSGPFGTHQFALQGADVIKIEPPAGDDTRTITVNKALAAHKMAPAFQAVNSNKKSVVLDLKDAKAIDVIRRMLTEMDIDIVWENFRPGVMDKLGLGYEALKAIHPRLIYCSISGFGHTGPEKNTAAFDGKIQAMSGVMSVTGDKGEKPVKAGVPVADIGCALFATYGLLSAYIGAPGEGYRIALSQLEAGRIGIAAQCIGNFFAQFTEFIFITVFI